MLRQLVAVSILLCAGWSIADEPREVRLSLGGPRKVTATVREQQENLEITVRMVAVGCFDPATNNRLNRDKAKAYAMHALAAHLRMKQAFTVKELTFGESRTEGRIYSLVISIPKDGIIVAGDGPPTPPSKTEKAEEIDLGKFQGLFTAKDDYIGTLRLLSANNLERLPSKPGKASQQDGFFQSIADLEESGVRSFASLRKEVKADKRLLHMEVDEILALIDKDEAAFLKCLKQQVDEVSDDNKE